MQEFGYDFQLKFIYYLIYNRPFYLSVVYGLKTQHFNKPLRYLVQSILELYQNKNDVLTIDDVENYFIVNKNVLSTKLSILLNSEFENLIQKAFEDIRKITSDTTSFNYIAESAKKFLQSTTLITLAQNFYNEISVNDNVCPIEHKLKITEQYIQDYKKVLQLGTERKSGLSVFDLEAQKIDNILQPEKIITTPWDCINRNCTGGGLLPGQISVIMGPGGCGKSHIMAQLGAYTFLQGKNVFLFSLEMDEVMYMQRVNIQLLTYLLRQEIDNNKLHKDLLNFKIDSNNISEERNMKLLNKLLKNYKNQLGNLNIWRFGANVISVLDLQSQIEQTIDEGIKPDLILVDYAALLKPSKHYTERRFELMNLINELRNLGIEYQLHVATVHHTNRISSENKEYFWIPETGIAEAFNILQVVDYLFSINTVNTEYYDNIMHRLLKSSASFWNVIKIRNGIDKMKLLGTLDTYRSNLELYDKSDPKYNEIWDNFKSVYKSENENNKIKEWKQKIVRGGTL